MIKKKRNNETRKQRNKEESEPATSSKTVSKEAPKKQPQTMEELLRQTGYKLHGFKKGEVVEGEIASLSPKEILIDIGGKTEGIVTRRELPLFRDLIPNLKVGEKVMVRVMIPEGEKGHPILSLREMAAARKWEDLKEKAAKEEEIDVLARKMARAGVLVEYQGLRGFIPQSQLDSQFASSQKSLLGRKVSVKILEVNQSLNRLVLSQKAVTQKEKIEKLKKVLKKIKVGQTLKAEVSGIVPFGLFCQTEEGLEGLVHISEIAWEKVENPSDYFKIKDKVKVKVLGIDEKEGKLNLSVKQLTPDPWEGIEKKYKKEQIVKGKVTRSSPFGAFVALEKGIEGLIHVSKIPAGVEFKEGEKIECIIEEIDKNTRRISLSYLPKEKPIGYK